MKKKETVILPIAKEKRKPTIGIDMLTGGVILPINFVKPIVKGKRKPTIGIDMLTGEIVSLKTGKAFPPLQATAKAGKK